MTVKTYKLLGYCNKCNFMICDADKREEDKVYCFSCKEDLLISDLLKERKVKREDLKDKKKYLDNIVKECSEKFDDIPDEFYSYVDDENEWD